MMKKIIVSFFCFLAGISAIAQKDSIVNSLAEVLVVADKKNQQEISGQKSIVISASQIVKNPTNLTELLRYNSPIYFKDYGNGGVSTARFRGTSATNTAVLWNGISINSVGNGQTDFNAIAASTSDIIRVQSGGGSTKYGSGAIGGVVHLEDVLDFEPHEEYQLYSSYGSFNTSSNFFKSNFGIGKWAMKISTTFNKSDNDYEFIDDRYIDENGNSWVNENGNYINYGINFSLGYQISETNKIYFYTTGYYGDRLFSDGLPNPSAGSERNEDLNQRNLLKWSSKFSGFTQLVNLAFLTGEYHYYGDKDAENFDFGKSKKFLVDYSLAYRFSNFWKFQSLLVYENTTGDTNLIVPKTRKALSIGGTLTHTPSSKFTTALSVRKEYNSDFSVPFSLALSVEHKIADFILLKGNISSNYRIPTFNEMYWPAVGNINLVPENSQQAEIGFDLDKKGFQFSSTAFYMDIDDKIIWIPAGNSNLWKPKNITNAVNKGAEFFVGYSKKIGIHSFYASGNYTYTEAKNTETQKQLPFAPKHLLNYNLEYCFAWAKIYFQDLYQSSVYTNEIGIDFYSLDPVRVMNLGIDFTLLENNNDTLVLGTKLNNMLDHVYYFTNLRPMPGRNYTININYKF